jgi:hypothetical protein
METPWKHHGLARLCDKRNTMLPLVLAAEKSGEKCVEKSRRTCKPQGMGCCMLSEVSRSPCQSRPAMERPPCEQEGAPRLTGLSPVRPCHELCGSYPSGPGHVLLDADLQRVAPTTPGAWMLATRKGLSYAGIGCRTHVLNVCVCVCVCVVCVWVCFVCTHPSTNPPHPHSPHKHLQVRKRGQDGGGRGGI